MNLGATVNSSASDGPGNMPANGLEFYFASDRPGGSGDLDLWMTTRAATSDSWGEPVNLGPTANSPSWDADPSVSADGLTLFFSSDRPGGLGRVDLYMSRRSTISDPWSEPVNLGSAVNTPVGG